MEGTKEFLDAWVKTQQRTIEQLTAMAQGFQKTLWGLGPDGGGLSDFQNLYDSWAKAVTTALGGGGTADTRFVRETLARSMNGTSVYAKLWEAWLPFLKAFQGRTVSPEAFQDLVDPAKYKEAIDMLFGFRSGAASQLSKETEKLREALAGSAKEFIGPWAEASAKNLKSFPEILEGQPDTFMKIFHNVFQAFDSTFGRVFHIPAVGKDREKVELLLKGFDDLAVFLAKSTEYRQMIYGTGLAAMEKVTKTVAKKVQSGENLGKFDDFFDLWLDESEKTYHGLFATEEFAKLQGELLESYLNVRKHFFKLVELHLYDFPIALRSEMDDLYKTVYDLKKRVKDLERQDRANA